MAKPSEVAPNEGSHVLLYGPPKVGKSTLAAELMLAGFHLWWISLDNGHEVIYKIKQTSEQLNDNCDLFVIPDTRDFPVAREVIRKVTKGDAVNICDRHGQAECSTCKKNNGSFSRICLNEFDPKRDILVIDHAGQLSTSVMASLTRNVPNPEEYKPSFTDYMNQGTVLDSIFSNIQVSRANIIVITHEVETELEDGTKRIVPQIGTAAFSRNSAKYFGHVVYLQVKNRSHKAGSSTVYDTVAITGSRSDVAIEKLEPASLVPFFNGVKRAIRAPEHGKDSPVAKAISKPDPEQLVEALSGTLVSEEKPPETEQVHTDKEIEEIVTETKLQEPSRIIPKITKPGSMSMQERLAKIRNGAK